MLPLFLFPIESAVGSVIRDMNTDEGIADNNFMYSLFSLSRRKYSLRNTPVII